MFTSLTFKSEIESYFTLNPRNSYVIYYLNHGYRFQGQAGHHYRSFEAERHWLCDGADLC